MADKFQKIGAGWRNKSGKGYSCKVERDIEEGERFFIFSNTQKKEDRHPDIVLGVFVEDEAQPEEPSRPEPPDDGIPF
jgi:hypothetical protein